ncbi:Cadherin-related family member 3, partial [Varanus komodoensis]
LGLLRVTFESPQPLAEGAPEFTVVTNISVAVPAYSSLVGEPAIVNANPIVHPFAIIPKGADQWQLMTTASPKLDFEAISLYAIPVFVRDSKGNSASQTIFVQIADVNEPPVLTGALSQPGRETFYLSTAAEIYIAEDTLENTEIFRVTAQDPEGAPLKFSIEISPNHTVLEIDETGAVSTTESFGFDKRDKVHSLGVLLDPEFSLEAQVTAVARSAFLQLRLIHQLRPYLEYDCLAAVTHALVTSCLDFCNALYVGLPLKTVRILQLVQNRAASYSVKVTVADLEGLSVNGYLTVFPVQVMYSDHILNCMFFSIEKDRLTAVTESSVSMKLVNIILDEEIPIGKSVGKCHVTGKGPMADITFSLDLSNPYFMIDRTHGTLLIVSRLDVEEDGFSTAQTFVVKACNKELKCPAIPVVANIQGLNDNRPFCDPYVYRYTSEEVLPNNTVVAEIRCHDRDKPPDRLHYEPNSGPVGAGKLFEQVPSSRNAVRVTQDLDYEDPRNLAVSSTHQMTISVFDDVNPSHTVTATIIVEIKPVNEFSPVFSKDNYVFAVSETAGAHHKVGKVTATDKDYPPNCVTYRIVSGSLHPPEIFWVHPETGTIELTTQPDYESAQQHKLIIEAVDCDLAHPRSAAVLVTINIDEENDEAPECRPSTYRATVLDSALPGTNINSFQLNCHDRDSLDTAMRFEIVSGNSDNHFGFDPSRGSSSSKLIVKTPFDFDGIMEFQPLYHLVVHIIDDNVYNTIVSKPRTGTVLIDIVVLRTRTPPTTIQSEEKKGLTIVYTSVNTFHSSSWYISFAFMLMAIMSLGLVAWWCYLIWRYGRCKETCLKQQAKSPGEVQA